MFWTPLAHFFQT